MNDPYLADIEARSTRPQLVAVDSHVPEAGAIVWWRLSGSIKRVELEAAWEDHDLPMDKMPASPTPAVALRRAMQEFQDRTHFVRALKGNGFALVEEDKEVETLAHRTILAASLDLVGRLKMKGPRAWQDSLEKSFAEALEEIDTTDVSAWLVRYMPWLDAVSLRDSGGVYFVPRGHVEELARIASALASCGAGHAVHRVPAMCTAEAVAAILDSMNEEVGAILGKIAGEAIHEDLGDRAIESRITRLNALQAKVARYERLLGAGLQDTTASLQGILAELGAARLERLDLG